VIKIEKKITFGRYKDGLKDVKWRFRWKRL